ncbi:mitochondrial fission ELM1 family protein [Lysobacter humi (ex Lee et al. 2017)]
MQRPPLSRIWTLTDGHAGNLRQARALGDALRLPLHDIALQPRLPWRWAAPRRLPGSEGAFGGDFAERLGDADLASTLVIGCGRQAALATRLLRERGARAVQILDPRITPSHWDAVVAPRHDRLRGANVLDLIGSLNPVTDTWLGAARAAFAKLGELPGPRVTLLVGGPTDDVRLRTRELDRRLRDVRGWIEQHGGSVLATTSRRTPPTLVERVRRGLGGLPGLVWTGSVDGRNPYAALLGWADRVVCTADSVNMVSEACATRAPVYVVGLDRARGRPRRFLHELRERGRLRVFDAALPPFEAEPLRETARVAAVLRERLGLDAAQ